jgi:hypothetical protein
MKRDGKELKSMEEIYLEDEFKELDPLLEMLREELNKPRAFFVNPKRFYEFQAACAGISEIVLEVNPDAKIQYEVNEFGDGAAAVRIDMRDLEVTDIKRFYDAVRYADNFEIYPISSGHIRMAMMFYGVLYAVAL